jgi:hypothetical protein
MSWKRELIIKTDFMEKGIKKQHYFVCIALLLCIMTAGCKKQKHTPINADMKRYFSFKKGTYWIYKDSLSGEMDSFIVLTNTYTTIATSNGEIEDEEIDDISVYTNGVFNSISCSWVLINNLVGYIISIDQTGLNYQLFIYPFQQGYTSPTTGYTITNVFATYYLDGNTFNTVAQIYQNGYSDLFYISIDAGIIKMKFNHTPLQKTWELQRYKILH